MIDRLLEKHAALARRLKRLLDILKPQDKVRIRYQEEGSELDLDVALRSLIDFKSGASPDPRINMSHRTTGATWRCWCCSTSRSRWRQGQGRWQRRRAEHSRTESGGGVAARLVDRATRRPFCHRRLSLRHPARRPLPAPQRLQRALGRRRQGRLAAMQAGYSTRMGAAMRHAAHYLAAQKAEKKLLLILTDGQPFRRRRP
jgi:nitric oxide reductase NorD protein